MKRNKNLKEMDYLKKLIRSPIKYLEINNTKKNLKIINKINNILQLKLLS